MKKNKEIKASCSACIHRQVCYKKLEFPDIVPMIQETGHCATFEPTFYDFIMHELKGCGFEDD